jgi:hypothetical protein
VQAPLFRDASETLYGREHVRFAINFSYLKYSSNNNALHGPSFACPFNGRRICWDRLLSTWTGKSRPVNPDR